MIFVIPTFTREVAVCAWLNRFSRFVSSTKRD